MTLKRGAHVLMSPYSQPARALWFDRKKYVTINFMVHKPKDVRVEFYTDKMILWWGHAASVIFSFFKCIPPAIPLFCAVLVIVMISYMSWGCIVFNDEMETWMYEHSEYEHTACRCVFSCRNDDNDVIYNELHFYDKIQIHVCVQFYTHNQRLWRCQ